MNVFGMYFIASRGPSEPTVTNLSGTAVTAKRGSAKNSIDVTFNYGSVTALIISPADFTATVS